ncbi:hypothetical protein AXG93_1200s1160 [Marchantia polymorpha subsp. ruderalis]|uniref:Uncharacterized protein n=1 Tax=Marchantia polymorpha subsp. ruderalis TaxID=1480154 RepID=A0A176WK65_MARPO|nr:hypothetical protein AXG93_1200s1160 [Marchantia polymorpha subsp. ruderalis]
MGRAVETVEDVVAQMKLLLTAVPPRPSFGEVEAAKLAIRDEESSLSAKLDELFSEPCPPAVPPRVFRALQEMHESVIRTQSEQEGRSLFERGAKIEPVEPKTSAEPALAPSSGAADEELLGARWPPNLLSILETAEKDGQQPEALDFSNGGYTWIPESIGMLVNLTSLDLSGNMLSALPESIGLLTHLTSLDVEANLLKSLPESLGLLTCLQTLNIEKNSIEELPWTIGKCTALVELRADFNQLKALPEAVGQLRSLRILSVHLNCLKTLPTTMASLTSLTELYVHFNQLDTLPESICSLTSLQKLDASSNFSDFRSLPPSIGNLQGLRDLDLSFNHLSVLPDSFAQLTNLRRLKLDGNPWRSPPLEVVAEGQQAVLEYMAKWKERDLEEKAKEISIPQQEVHSEKQIRSSPGSSTCNFTTPEVSFHQQVSQGLTGGC